MQRDAEDSVSYATIIIRSPPKAQVRVFYEFIHSGFVYDDASRTGTETTLRHIMANLGGSKVLQLSCSDVMFSDSQITFFSCQVQSKKGDGGEVVYTTLKTVPSDPSI